MYVKMTPILPVPDVCTERAFYETLGFRLHVDPSETYPEDEFAALVCGESILFGLARSAAAEPLTERGLYWQFETTDLERVHERAVRGSLEIIDGPTLQPWGRRTMTLRSPNGYRVGFEESA